MNLDRLERYRDIVDDWPAFHDACTAPLPTTLWTNTLRLPPGELADQLLQEGVEVRPLPWYSRGFRLADPESRPGKTLAYITGACHIQEEVSMLSVPVLDPRPRQRLLDLCAAPGNKTMQSAVHMDNTGTVLANDADQNRLGMVVRNVERIGVTNTATLNWNGANLPRSGVGEFDRVLADVPCSCEGTTRKNPYVLFHSVEQSQRYAGGQAALLQKAVQLCRPGGRIVYSTCTYAPEENERVVDGALRFFEGRLRVLPVEVPGFRGAPGLVHWQGQDFDPSLAGCLRAYPHLQDTGGFFVALLEKLPEDAT
ncbi:MAG: RsmB/NOP family class I SAM-dependent RNA methyltransferase [Acidobacteriota bacterium]